MAVYVIRALPKGVKVDNIVSLSDITEYRFETTDANVAKSSVDGSRQPMAAFTGSGETEDVAFDNLHRINRRFMGPYNRMKAAGEAAERLVTIGRRPQKRAQQPVRQERKGGPKGRFDHVKPLRGDEKPKREVIVERV